LTTSWLSPPKMNCTPPALLPIGLAQAPGILVEADSVPVGVPATSVPSLIEG